MNKDLITYYKNRAAEYERIYLKPERQNDLLNAGNLLQNIFTGKNVFEIACGTGFWTEKIALTANSVLATDINETVLQLARSKKYAKSNVTFKIEDIYNMSHFTKYDSLFGGFIFSHVKVQDIDNFLSIVKSTVTPGGTIVLMDNNFVEGSSHPITSTDTDGNTFQTRKLDDGTTHIVLKNFPTGNFLRTKLSGITNDFEFINLKYFWILTFKI